MAVPTPLDRCLQPETGLAAEAKTRFAMYALPEDVARLRSPMSIQKSCWKFSRYDPSWISRSPRRPRL